MFHEQEEANDDGCDFCTMFGEDKCCLHRAIEVFGMGMLIKASIVNSDKKCSGGTINYNSNMFEAVFSNIPNRWVLVYKDESNEDEEENQQLYRMYLNMNKGVKGTRRTYEEYKKMLAKYK